MNRVKQVIESAGDPTRSEFHRGWHGACQMVKAALAFDEADVTERIKIILSTECVIGMPDWWRDTLEEAIEKIGRFRRDKEKLAKEIQACLALEEFPERWEFIVRPRLDAALRSATETKDKEL